MIFSLNKQIQWLSRHITFVYIGGTIVFILVCMCIFLANQSFILVSVDGDTKSLKTYTSTDSETVESSKSTGLLLVSRNTKSLIVTKNDYIKTQVPVNLPWYGFTTKKVTFQDNKSAVKVAYKSTVGAECMTYAKQLDSLRYYNCRNPRSVMKYNTPRNSTWTASVASRISYTNGKATPYMGGVIGFVDLDISPSNKSQFGITSYSPDGARTVYNIPNGMNEKAIQAAQIFTDTDNTDNARFAIVDADGTIFLGTPQGDEVNYATISKPDNYTQNNNSLCSISTIKVYCYRGKAPVGDIEDKSITTKIAGYSIVSSNFDGTNQTSDELQNFQESLDTLTQVGDTLYGKAYKKLFIFKKTSDYRATELAQNVDSIAGGKKLYYIQSRGIFTYDDKENSSQQIFFSSFLAPKTLLSSEDSIFFTAQTNEDNETMYAYKLVDTGGTGNGLIDSFPRKVEGAYSMDLVANRLSVTLDNVTSRSASRQFIDPAKLAEAKDNFTATLAASGFDLSAIEIEFTY